MAETKSTTKEPSVALLLTSAAAANFLGVGRTTFYRLLETDDLLKPVKIPGMHPRWRRSDLEAYVAQLSK